MITFKEFLLKEWHIITDEDFLLIESLDPVKWKQHDDTHVHKTTIDGKRLAIYIDQHHHGNYVTQHSVRFEVNGTLSKKKRTNSATGKKILLHVARAVNSYTNEHTKEGDIITMSGYDSNPNTQKMKDTAYNSFAKRLAKAKGGEHRSTTNSFGTIHSVHL